MERVLSLWEIRKNWWSKCHSVENSRGLFVLFSDSYYPQPLPEQSGQRFIFRHL
jgi:hypothetical protein